MPTQSTRSRLTALGCVVLTGGLLVPPTATAEPHKTPILDSARTLAASRAATLQAAQGSQQAPAPRTDLRTRAFFKTRAGLATLAIFGAGVGYALYSANNDRIKSPGR
jgi:hypothetical protein